MLATILMAIGGGALAVFAIWLIFKRGRADVRWVRNLDDCGGPDVTD